ncbi:MAG TPA: hypothetical protein VFC92_03550 [Bacteroidales bacterium]|nr:hypothetical protein [Bacteroidales bacterium]
MKDLIITLAIDSHRDTPLVRMNFEKDFALIGKVKTIRGAASSQSHRFWYIAQSDFKLNSVFETLKDLAWVDDLEI